MQYGGEAGVTLPAMEKGGGGTTRQREANPETARASPGKTNPQILLLGKID